MQRVTTNKSKITRNSDFTAALAHILKHEAGFQDDPRDEGNKQNEVN